MDLEARWGGDEANGEGVLLCVRVDAAVRVACCLAAGCWLLAGSLGPRVPGLLAKS